MDGGEYLADRFELELDHLGDLEAWHAIQVTCTKCGRQSLVAPHELHARHRPHKIIGAIRLKCSACGCTEVSWEVMQARPPRARGTVKSNCDTRGVRAARALMR